MKDKCLKLRFRAISEFSEAQVFDNGTLTIKDFGWSDRGRCTYSSHNFTNPEFSIFVYFRNGILSPKLFRPTVRKNCSSDQEKLLKFEAEGRVNISNFLRSLEQFIQTVKGQMNFWNRMFLTCSWRFLRSNTLEQLEFKLEKIIGVSKSKLKVRRKKCLR